MALPKHKRKEVTGIGTYKAFAQHHDVTPQTIQNWKNKKEFMDEVELVRRQYLDEQLSDIYHTMVQKAKEGHTQSMEMAIKLSGRMTEAVREAESKADIKKEEAERMSDAALVDTLSKRIANNTGLPQDQVQKAVQEEFSVADKDLKEFESNQEDEFGPPAKAVSPGANDDGIPEFE